MDYDRACANCKAARFRVSLVQLHPAWRLRPVPFCAWPGRFPVHIAPMPANERKEPKMNWKHLATIVRALVSALTALANLVSAIFG